MDPIERMRRATGSIADQHADNQGFSEGTPDDTLGFGPAATPTPDEGAVDQYGPETGPIGSFGTPGLELYANDEDVLEYSAPHEFDYRDDTATYDADVAAN